MTARQEDAFPQASQDRPRGSRWDVAVSWVVWPMLLAGAILATAFGFRLGWPAPTFAITYAGLAVTLLALERWRPHERAWTASDGEAVTDVLHTLVSNGAVQALVVVTGAIEVSAAASRLSAPVRGSWLLWPCGWPLAAQIILGLVVVEFALYWAHRLAHEWTALWRFHAIHHSVEKLWVVNSGRFHVVDAVKSVAPSLAILLALGAPMDVITWLSAIGAYVGILTHCNVAMRFGVLSLVFNTPELHRWHHSMDLREGNKNYGENIMLWDWVFGTWFNEPARRPPAEIGIADTMPTGFSRQLVWPFARSFARRL